MQRLNGALVYALVFSLLSATASTSPPSPPPPSPPPLSWFQGHDDGKRGLASYGEPVADPSSLPGAATDWVVMCGTNDANVPILANGINVRSDYVNGSGDVTLLVNPDDG